ncbi:DUF3305 domain-containing protein [Noviherbaspirillum galbum]|uniref:DUF3305 domain-containing protein n=1 Tax=Noviherbaspirillum galbum TaxID=2709383 RepID=A0A6B3SRP6_9BURK|nr:DUF3305 domain-containing protein [Noviherbaspirillum galbum]NEX63198.1 DUF3305 domain-containing protein [Noviherbaspirillum galbum]
METDAINAAVVMQRLPLASRWQSWQWKPVEVDVPTLLPAAPPRCLRNDESDARWLFTGFEVRLYTDEAEGYFLNVDSPAPCWFVMWRLEDIDGEEVAVPKALTLSYNEAARLMDGGERVDTVPAPAEVIEQLRAFALEHYRPEPKKKRRKPSFEGGAGVEQMARAEGGSHGS